MIRIDLGKGSFEEKSGISKQIEKLNLPPQVVARVQKLTSDVGTIAVIVVSLAIALIFPLLAKQFREASIEAHEARVKEINQKISSASNEITKFNHHKAELESYNNQKSLVSNRLNAVSQLLEARGTPVNILDSVGQSLPPRGWYSSVDLSLASESASLQLTGFSYSHEEISDLVEKLSESVYLSDIVLEDVGGKVEDKVDVKTFSISAKAKPNLVGAAMAANPEGVGK